MCVRLCFLKWIAADTFNSVEWKTLNHTTFRHSIQNNCVQNTEKVRSFGSGAYCASVQFTEQHYVQPHFIKVSPIRMELNYQSMCRPVESSTAGVDSFWALTWHWWVTVLSAGTDQLMACTLVIHQVIGLEFGSTRENEECVKEAKQTTGSCCDIG